MTSIRPTTRSLFESRMIQLALIGLLLITIDFLISKGITVWCIWLTRSLSTEEAFKADIYLQIIKTLSMPISGAIATIVTAVVARYGFREATRNIGEGMAAQGNSATAQREK